MSFGDAPTSESKPRGPATRDGLIIAVVFASIILVTAVMVLFRMLPGTSSANSGRSPNVAPGLAKSPDHPSNAPANPHATEPKSGIGFSPFPSAFSQPDEEPVRVVERSNAELRARAKSRVLALQELGREIRNSLEQAEKVVAEWSQRSTDLLTNDDGRKLATQSDLVERFEALQSLATQSPVSTATVTTWRQQLSALLQPLVLPEDDAREVVMPGDALEADLKSLQQVLSERLRVVRENVAALNSLLAAARDVKAGEQTLQQALTTLNEDRQRKLVESKAAGRRKADEAARTALEQAEQTQRAAEIALELAEKKAAAAGIKKRADDATEAVARKQRLAKVKNEIEQYLEPFITPGYAQPRQMSGTFMDVVQTKEKKPMSLAGLRKIGALEDDETGMHRLYRAASNFSNDRPKWSEAYNHQLTVKAHDLLIKYAEDMVAEGWLSP